MYQPPKPVSKKNGAPSNQGQVSTPHTADTLEQNSDTCLAPFVELLAVSTTMMQFFQGRPLGKTFHDGDIQQLEQWLERRDSAIEQAQVIDLNTVSTAQRQAISSHLSKIQALEPELNGYLSKAMEQLQSESSSLYISRNRINAYKSAQSPHESSRNSRA